MTTPPPLCMNCASLEQIPSNGKMISTCGQSGQNAYAERANPNGCGPSGVNFTAKT